MYRGRSAKDQTRVGASMQAESGASVIKGSQSGKMISKSNSSDDQMLDTVCFFVHLLVSVLIITQRT
eukprot:33147-Eustigmatos_ZCMA.PRE.1